MQPRVILQRRGGALVVVLEPPLEALHKTFLLPLGANKRFSGAAGYACGLAVQYDLEFEDRTGRLSAADCAGLVAELRDEQARGVIA